MNLKKILVAPTRIADDDVHVATDNSLEYNLNSLLAEEFQAFYQYFWVLPFLHGQDRPDIEEEFRTHAFEELEHANKLQNRLNELGMRSYLATPDSWKEYAVAKYMVAPDFDVIHQCALNMNAEIAAIEHYYQVLATVSDVDVVTQDLLKEIIADEEHHKTDMLDFINDNN